MKGSGKAIGILAGGMLAFSAVFVSPVFSAEALKIGFVDAQKVLDSTAAGKKAKDGMQEFVKSRQKIVDLDEAEIKQLQDDLARQASVLSPDARREKEDALQRKFLEYQRRAADLNKEVQGKTKEILEKFNQELEKVVKKVADRGAYSLVIDRNAEGGVLLFAKESLNLTDEVIKEFEKSGPPSEKK